MDGAQLEYLGNKLDRIAELQEALLVEVRWSHRDDPVPAGWTPPAPPKVKL
jgi:hypothetical protein